MRKSVAPDHPIFPVVGERKNETFCVVAEIIKTMSKDLTIRLVMVEVQNKLAVANSFIEFL